MLSLLTRLRSLWRGIRRNDALNDDMDAEFRLHMELRAADLVRSGLPPAEAARRARLEFGSTESFKDRGREARGLRWFDGMRFSLLDVKLGGRMLVKHPGLTAIGTIAVAFAIAVGSVTFEVIQQVVFPTLPLPNGNEIVVLRNWHIDGVPVWSSRRDYTLWKRDLSTVSTLSAVAVQERNVALGAGGGEPTDVADVTASMFEMTRVPALMGRTLSPTDERADAADVVVIGYDFWQNKLAGATDVLGKVVRVSGAPATIVGVMPPGYGFPIRNGFWRPLHIERIPETWPRLTYVFGRLVPGHSRDEANAEVAALGARTAATFPEPYKHLRGQVVTLPRAKFNVSGMQPALLGSANMFLVLLLSLVFGNVALLLFARAASRQKELIVRAALGAGRGRIITQLFTEALVLCSVGAVLGLVVSNVVLRWAWAMIESQEGPAPFWASTQLSPTTILYAIALTLLAAIIAGVVPALKVTSGGVDARLRAMSSGGGGLQFGGVWTAIIVAQIALSVVLPLPTVGLRGDLAHMRNVPAGFAADEYLNAHLGLDRFEGVAAGGDTTPAARVARFESRFRTLMDRLQTEPGVIGATYANRLPLMYHSGRLMEMDAGPVAPVDPNWPKGYRVSGAVVDPRFFDVVGAPVVRGRSLTSADAEPTARSVVVNESFVKRVMGGRNPIGRQLRYLSPEQRMVPTGEPGPWHEIVGVVPDLGISGTEKDPSVARIYHARPPKDLGPIYLAIHVRGDDPERFTPRLRELATSIDPALRIGDPMPLSRVLEPEIEFLAFWVRMLAGLTVVALVLSLAGVYAVMAFAVAKRTREIGVRVALGARPRQIIFSVFKRPLRQIALGIAAGSIVVITVFTLGASRVTAEGLSAMAVCGGTMGVFCALACIVPTRRALRIQPTEALKDEG